MKQNQNKTTPALGANTNDRIATIGRSLASAVPLVGGALAEIITEIIPNQRLDRIESYLHSLAEKVAALSPDQQSVMKEPSSIDLIEEGAKMAARALSSERIGYIADCVARGISGDALKRIYHKRILSIVDQLDDQEVLLLDAYAKNNWEAFEKFRPPPAYIGAPEEVVEADAMHQAATDKIERLSLIEFEASHTSAEIPDEFGGGSRDLRLPDLDTFGRPRGYRHITQLGRIVHAALGLSAHSPTGKQE